MKTFKYFVFISILSHLVIQNCFATSDFFEQSSDELKEGIESKHPATYLILAAKLFGEDEKNEAVKWYYVGQIRFRAYLMANPELEPSGDPALYSSLKYMIGSPINEYAGSDPDNWVALIDSALIWHAEKPNHFTPKDTNKEIYKEIENGFNEIRNRVESSKDEIRKQRAENGLENG
ncbi:hypothetical protein [Glaciecola sp. 1036]|uniref:hypothetical protein n=1 Tax=Alteromonadaceae TaxID=72275 RepID=UPI003D01999B